MRGKHHTHASSPGQLEHAHTHTRPHSRAPSREAMSWSCHSSTIYHLSLHTWIYYPGLTHSVLVTSSNLCTTRMGTRSRSTHRHPLHLVLARSLTDLIPPSHPRPLSAPDTGRQDSRPQGDSCQHCRRSERTGKKMQLAFFVLCTPNNCTQCLVDFAPSTVCRSGASVGV